jgi:hypothetical protein
MQPVLVTKQDLSVMGVCFFLARTMTVGRPRTMQLGGS